MTPFETTIVAILCHASVFIGIPLMVALLNLVGYDFQIMILRKVEFIGWEDDDDDDEDWWHDPSPEGGSGSDRAYEFSNWSQN